MHGFFLADKLDTVEAVKNLEPETKLLLMAVDPTLMTTPFLQAFHDLL